MNLPCPLCGSTSPLAVSDEIAALAALRRLIAVAYNPTTTKRWACTKCWRTFEEEPPPVSDGDERPPWCCPPDHPGDVRHATVKVPEPCAEHLSLAFASYVAAVQRTEERKAAGR